MEKLKRTLGQAEVIFFGVGSILGAGIYALIGKVAGSSGNMTWLSLLIASFTALMTAFSYAELSSMFPKAGGEYTYVKNALNKRVALFIGCIISLNGIVSGATVSIGFAGYLAELTGISLLPGSLLIITLIWLVNMLGIKQSSILNIIFTLVEFSGLVLIIIVASPYIGNINYFERGAHSVNDLMIGAALGYFAYIGFEEIVKLSGETKKPQKRIPIALFTASGIVIITYTLIAISVVSVLPADELNKSNHPLSDIMRQTWGHTGVMIITLIALFATSNTILSNMIGSSRVLYEIGKENRLLKKVSKLSEKSKVPFGALILVSLLMGLFAAIGKLEKVALIANFFILITFLFVNISVIILRIISPHINRPYKIPLSLFKIPVICVAGIISTVTLLIYVVLGIKES